jgi:hypothetical protein
MGISNIIGIYLCQKPGISASIFFSMEYATHLYPEYGDEKLEELACRYLQKAGELKGCLHPLTARSMKVRVARLDAESAICLDQNKMYSPESPVEFLFPSPIAISGEFGERLFHEFQLRSIVRDLIREKGAAFNPVEPYFLKYLDRMIMGTKDREGDESTIESVEYGVSSVSENDSGLEHLASRYALITEGNRPVLRALIASLSLLPRMLNINPFGRNTEKMARLTMTNALSHHGLDAEGLFSVNRALAINLREYTDLLDAWELWPSQSGINLNYEGLSAVTSFLFEILLREMEAMLDFFSADRMAEFIRQFVRKEVEAERLRSEAEWILMELFVRGKTTRQDLMRITGTSDKTLKIITDQLVDRGQMNTDLYGVRMEYTLNY